MDFVSRRGAFSAQRADADAFRFDRVLERLENIEGQFAEARKINLVLVGLLTRSLRENRQERTGGGAATMEDARTSCDRFDDLASEIVLLRDAVAALGHDVGHAVSRLDAARSPADQAAAGPNDGPAVACSDAVASTQPGRDPKDALSAGFDRLEAVLGEYLGGLPETIAGSVLSALGRDGSEAAMLEVLSDRLEALRTRPDPVLDLGPQRRSFAVFGMAMSRVLSRFDDIEKRMSHSLATVPDENVLGQLEEKVDRLLDIVARHATTGTVSDEILPKDLTPAIDAPRARIAEAVKVPTVAGEVHLLSFRKSLTGFQVANRHTVDRLGLLVDGLGEKLSALEAAADANGAVLERLVSIADEARAAFSQARSRPSDAPAMPDMLQRQASLARIQTAAKVSLDRFEKLLDRFADRCAENAAGLRAVERTASASDGEHRRDGVEDLVASVTSLAQANLLLADTRNAPKRLDREFLAELRIMFAESVAVLLRSESDRASPGPS